MRKIIVSEMVTVDGFFAGSNGELDWFIQSEELDAYAMDLLESSDTILYGRKTYEMMAGFWPSAPGNFAARTNKLPKLVFSKTLQETPWGEWNNAKPIPGDLAKEVRRLKQQPGQAIVLYGSGSLVSQLTHMSLINEYRLMVCPVVLGTGRSLFQGASKALLTLVETKKFGSDIVLLRYQPDRKES